MMAEAWHTAVLILHVLGAAIIIGVAFVTLIIELKKYLSSKQMMALIEFIWKIAGAALGVQILTGLYLAGSEWDKIGKIPYFWIKMVLFFVLGIVVGIVNQRRFKKLQAGKADTGGTKWSLIGLLTFGTIAALGVMITESSASMNP